MSFILDLFLIFIFLVCVYTGFKRGFIRSIMSVVVVVIAILGSIKLTPMLSGYLNEKFVSPVVNDKVEASITSLIEEVDSIDITKLLEDKPKALIDLLDKFGVSYEEVNDFFNEKAESSQNPEKEVSEYISSSLSETISNAVAFAILFIVLSLVLTLIMLAVNTVVKLPVLNGLNKGLGLILGILKGALYAWGLTLVFINLFPHLAVIYEGQIPPTLIDDTVIVKLLGAVSISSLF